MAQLYNIFFPTIISAKSLQHYKFTKFLQITNSIIRAIQPIIALQKLIVVAWSKVQKLWIMNFFHRKIVTLSLNPQGHKASIRVCYQNFSETMKSFSEI